MTALNFGVEWDSTNSLKSASDKERERARLDAEKERDGRKMTPAQRRDHAYGEISEAASEQNIQRVKELLDENPKIDFQVGAVEELKVNVVENFDTTIATMLVNRGLKLDYNFMANLLAKRENEEMFVFLLNSPSKNQTIPHGVLTLGSTCLKRFSPNISESRRTLYRSYHKRISEKFSSFWQSIANNQYTLKDLVVVFTPELPEEEKQQLANLPEGKWKEAFNLLLSPGRHAHMNANILQSIVDFCNEYPFAKSHWDTIVSSMPTQAQVFGDFMNTYWPEGVEFTQSELYKTISAFNSRGYSYSTSEKIEPPMCFQKIKLGLSDREVAMLRADKWTYLHLKEKNGQHPPFKELAEFSPANLVENLVAGGSAACFALLEDAQGIKVYKESLENPAIFYRWCTQSSLELLNATIKTIPDLKEWTDNHNNTLAHYLVALRQEKSKSFVQMLARHNHNWFLHDNNNGVNVKTLFVENKISNDTLAFLDKEAIKRSLKEAGVSKPRRSKDEAPRRRM